MQISHGYCSVDANLDSPAPARLSSGSPSAWSSALGGAPAPPSAPCRPEPDSPCSRRRRRHVIITQSSSSSSQNVHINIYYSWLNTVISIWICTIVVHTRRHWSPSPLSHRSAWLTERLKGSCFLASQVTAHNWKCIKKDVSWLSQGPYPTEELYFRSRKKNEGWWACVA